MESTEILTFQTDKNKKKKEAQKHSDGNTEMASSTLLQNE